MSVMWRSGILAKFRAYPMEFQNYFGEFERLVEAKFSWDVVISYLFAKVETAQTALIHAAVVKIHKVDTRVARGAIDRFHMTRETFRAIYRTVLDKPIEPAIVSYAKSAEKIRDKILHGKKVNEADKRQAVIDVLDYASHLNEQTYTDGGFRPFGSLQGFKGRAKPLDKNISRWVLMGMGLISAPKVK